MWPLNACCSTPISNMLSLISESHLEGTDFAFLHAVADLPVLITCPVACLAVPVTRFNLHFPPVCPGRVSAAYV